MDDAFRTEPATAIALQSARAPGYFSILKRLQRAAAIRTAQLRVVRGANRYTFATNYVEFLSDVGVS